EGIVTSPLYLDVRMEPRSRVALELEAGHSAFAYVYEGRVRLGAAVARDATSNDAARELTAGQLAVLSEGEALTPVTGDASARFLLRAAQPLREPIARYGPFVMNTREEIAKAVEDYQRGTLIG